MARILLIGSGAREHIIAETFRRSRYNPKLFSYLKSRNPGIEDLSAQIHLGSYRDLEKIKKFSEENEVGFAFIGPEEPLASGVVDSLEQRGVPCIGPKKELAKLESSKSFTRLLMEEFNIRGNPKFKIFTKENIDEAESFISKLQGVVVKPDGLTGGKGVKVQGDHFQTKEEALDYCHEVLQTHPSVVVEEKLDGEEFSLMCLTDGKTVVAMPPVQDHKRAFNDDLGPNTGGMGSYSAENHLLPFLTKKDVEDGLEITKKVADALYKKTGQYYKGVMYAGLIATQRGVKLIEYNARFGDPEAMNVLSILKTDFVDVCNAIINQKLNKLKLEFENKATVCKYVVPNGYPDNPVKNERIVVEKDKMPQNSRLYYASVDKKEGGLYMSGSRAIAVVGIADSIFEAEKISETAASSVKGKVFHRSDIGTKGLIEKRVRHMMSFQMGSRICPKCKSTDISPDLSAESYGHGTIFNQYKCNKCGFSGQFFPELLD